MPSLRRTCIFAVAVACFIVSHRSAIADVKLPAIFGDHMVVQRGKPVTIWGWADPGEAVTVEVSGEIPDQSAAFKSKDVKTTAGKSGNWTIKLDEFPEGAVCDISVAGKNRIRLKDVLVGEVWICSGQSNMQMAVSASNNAKQEIAGAKYPKIRLFYVPRVPAGTPARDVNAKWQVCSPKTVGRFSAVAYFFGRQLYKELKVPIGLVHTSWGGTRIEPWTPPVGFRSVKSLEPIAEQLQKIDEAYERTAKLSKELGKKPPKHPLASAGRPTGLYNGMVAPLVPLSIRGAIWYQGESNRGDGLKYEQKMHALINGWRTVFKQGDFPFYYVQIAPYSRYRGNPELLAQLWEAQTNVLKMKNTGMAVTVDIGNLKNIHPKNKQDVGKRLALWALAKDYGKKDLVYSGPLYKSMKVEGDRIRIAFDHVGGGLVARDGKPLSWFTIAGKDGKFVSAKAVIDGDSVVVSSDDVKSPQNVRFGWSQVAEPNLSNKAGLPASPFRTDRK